ncbi:BCSC C-terminal domain-containing protein [Alloacidobacterium dinghuense]|uniref:BCSC C-terminal domain-containing protein n=1 Tax=Alloacidobacterium dinghuense TaxID=2763107 RepID=A0A7G8BKI1_9BACT|nr:cellulose biosynthesis protein BcsC [Alloacidobacterium dinghuense]QNI33051.1 BCSC C-terminal domain-containing protein [Alloacidobacterium dinghuense]
MEKVNRNACRTLLLVATCALALGISPGAWGQSTAERALLMKAQSLAANGHLDMAVQTWQQVLLADPNSREALLGIAKADMQLGNTDEARRYLDRLRAAGGNPADIAKIQAMPGVAPKNVRLDQAASLAQSGRYADAMRIYRDVLGNNPPAGDYALAYYDTEAAIPADRPHAVAGLRKLAQQFPADSRYSITLGRVLTYEPKTRAEGIAILQRYDNVPAAQSALKQAESWNAVANAAPTAVDTQAKPKASTPAGNPLEASAYRALNSGRLDEARQQFETLLAKQPNNPRALSGMGYVYMKQQDFADASDYLERARAAGARGLESAIATSRFWEKMSQAGAALQAGDSDAAIESYTAALSLKPSSPDALEGLGGAYVQAGNNAEAIDAFERAVRVSPDRQTAWRGLFLAQSAAGNSQGALNTGDRMPKNVRAQLNSDPEYLRALAQDNLALGRKAEADRAIERALALPFPNEGRDLPLDKQMQYAALLMMANRYEPALQLYQQIVAEDPGNAGAWRALIAAQHQLGRDNDALATMGSMPQAILNKEQSDPSFLVLVGSIYQTRHEWDRAQKYLEQALAAAPPPQTGIELQLADVYAANGNQQKAYTIYREELDRNPQNTDAWRGMLNALHQGNHDREALRQIAAMPESVRLRLEQDPSYLQTLASIQSATGQNQAALKTFAQLTQIYRDRNTDEPVDVLIQYGWVLLRTGDDQKLYALVTTLSNSADMTDDQQAEFNRLGASWSVRRANSALAVGDQNRAVAILTTAAQAFPGNAEVYSALAGVYLKIGQPRQAVAIYASLDMTHATSQLYESAIGAAMAARDMKQAETWLEDALDQYKSNPSILRLAAQYEQARGNSDRAAAYYRAALDAMGPAGPGGIFAQPGSDTGAPGTLSPMQQLMQLLAPAGRTARLNAPVDSSESGSAGDVSWLDAPSKSVPTLGDFAQSREGGSGRSVGDDAALRQPSTSALGDYGSRYDALTPTNDRYVPPTEAYVRPTKVTRRHSAPPVEQAVEQDQVSAPMDYLEPVTMKVPARPLTTPAPQNPPVSFAPTSKSAHFLDANDLNPASRLQSAVREMNGRVQDPQSTDTGLPPIGEGSRDATPPPVPLNALPETARAEAPALPPLTGPGVHVVRAKTPREQIEDQLAIIQGASSPWVGGNAGIDYRSGQPGYDKLSAYTGQIEASSMLGPGVRGTVITRPVLLDSGTATTTATFQQGTLPAGATPYLQSAAGIGGEFQLRTASFAANIGYTPYDFLVQNIIGGIYVHPPTSHFTLTFARDPITDTQLSYAGLRDLGSRGPTYEGNTWGGVVTNAGEFQLAFGSAQSGWYIQGGGQYISGRHVQDNTRLDGDAGAYWAVVHHPDYGNLTVGMNFFGMHYDHNLRYFTYGQGGYFSPDTYILAGVPVTFNGHHGARFHYRVLGSFGLQAFDEAATPYYPLDPTIQYARNNPYYSEATSVSANYSFEGEGAYAIAEHWYVGGYMSFNNTRDYASSKGGFYVRYLFRPQPMLEENGPTGLFPITGMRPLNVP